MSDATPSTDPLDLLLPYTGYYALDGRKGAFVLIDTNLLYAYYPGLPGHRGTTVTTIEATVTISMDGIFSTVYPFAGQCNLIDGRILYVRDTNRSIVATLDLSRDGLVSALDGFINNVRVAGRSPLGPIQLQVFASEYYDRTGPADVQLAIGQDLSVHYRQANGLLARVHRYYYNYVMFLLGFTAEDGPRTYEMGTLAGFGLVAGNAAKGGALVSIRNVLQAPKPDGAET